VRCWLKTAKVPEKREHIGAAAVGMLPGVRGLLRRLSCVRCWRSRAATRAARAARPGQLALVQTSAPRSRPDPPRGQSPRWLELRYLLEHSTTGDCTRGPEALALALELDRPILLVHRLLSCHWCHVMEREVFEQDDVAEFLNAHFISIKVDARSARSRPVIHGRGSSHTGSGGWPMSVLLTPSLRPFFGARISRTSNS